MLLKTIGKLSLPLIALVAFAACGDKGASNKEGVLTPKSTEIKGDLGEYFEVVNKDYTLSKEGDASIINVEVKRKDADFKLQAENTAPFGEGTANYRVGFGIELFDSTGNAKGIKNAIDVGKDGVFNTSDVVGLIKLKKGETGYIRWAIESPAGLKTFQLTSALEGSMPESPAATNGGTTPAKSVIDWDKVLDDYEALTNQYISLAKKAKNKDIAAMAELPLVMGKANDVASKVKKAKGELTPAQWSRFISIQTKLAQATLS
ncbi:MAG: hypothetical protein M0D57_21620 [Sphingobacteriales bacterium JAD_PAG50586_3]|nr:MAG: hypothetical protein M0D57_21620 [Sphingobacteriales bacterium JAD_PAG50586_3]